MMLFFSSGVLGMVIGLSLAPPSATMIITFMGVVNFGLGGFFAYVFLTQAQKAPDKRKKKRKKD